MKDDKRLPWVLSYSFYMFFTFYLAVKFVFIFFFFAENKPNFIFRFTPGFLISGFENEQLLFLALIVFFTGSYLHYKPTKKNMILSFIPTIILIAGMGIAVSSMKFSMSNLLYYVVFTSLIVVLLIDHRRLLDHPETLLKISDESFLKEFIDLDVSGSKTKPVVEKKLRRPALAGGVVAKAKKIDVVTADICVEKDKISKSIIQDEVFLEKQKIIDDLERRTERLDRLENEMEMRRKKLVEQEKIITDLIISSSSTKNKQKSFVKKIMNSSSDDFDDIKESAVLVQRGKMKKINQFFADSIGYNVDEMVDKNLIHFIVPEGFSEVEEFYLKRLKGKAVSSFETVFKTKENKKLHVSVKTKPVLYDGKKAEIVILKKINKK